MFQQKKIQNSSTFENDSGLIKAKPLPIKKLPPKRAEVKKVAEKQVTSNEGKNQKILDNHSAVSPVKMSPNKKAASPRPEFKYRSCSVSNSRADNRVSNISKNLKQKEALNDRKSSLLEKKRTPSVNINKSACLRSKEDNQFCLIPKVVALGNKSKVMKKDAHLGPSVRNSSYEIQKQANLQRIAKGI